MSKHAEVVFYEDGRECDMCDVAGNNVIISTLGNDYLCICKNCLEKIIKGFEEEEHVPR